MTRDAVLETGPMCRCGARNTARVGDTSIRRCQVCDTHAVLRIYDGIAFLIPLPQVEDTNVRQTRSMGRPRRRPMVLLEVNR